MDTFKVRLNCIDHYQATPTRLDPVLRNDILLQQTGKEPNVPVVRVFGSTQTGQKVCAHIHGAFPYLYVEYTGSLTRDVVGAYMHRLHLSIDHAMGVSYRKNVYQEKPRFVARISLVKGIPFYGFHVGYRFYLKIYMFNPMVMTRLADLLQQGLVMNRKFQPYEAHLQYLLQFMTDFNLYGCDYIEAKRVTFRAPVPQYVEDDDSLHIWHSQSIPPARITNDYTLPRASHCSIEVDICVQDILNRTAVKERLLHHDFTELRHPIPADLKLVHSMAGLWRDETKRRKRRMNDLDPGSSPFPPDALVSMSADPRDSQPPGWLHEDEYRAQIQDLIAGEEAATRGEDLGFDSFVNRDPLEKFVKTTLESVEDLFPRNLGVVLGRNESSEQGVADHGSGAIDINAGVRVVDKAPVENDMFPSDSDEDMIPDTPPRETGGQLKGAMETAPDIVNNDVEEDSLAAMLRGIDGVTVSAQRSGVPPSIPIYPELISAARERGLFTEKPNLSRLGSNSRKRPSLDPDAASDPPKRIRLATEQLLSEPEQQFPLPPPSGQKTPTFVDNPGRQTQSKQPILAGDLQKRQGQNTLNFAVVKDPNDPSTKLRLSQPSLSQPSASQKTEESTPKQLSFNLKPDVAEALSSDKSSSEIVSLPRSSLSSSKSPRKVPTAGLISNSPRTMFVLNSQPPSADEVSATMAELGVPPVIYQDAYYSKEKDVPTRIREYAGREFRLEGKDLLNLPDFDPTGRSPATFGMKSKALPDLKAIEESYKEKRRKCTLKSWEIAELPPSYDEVETWWEEKQAERAAAKASGHASRPGDSQRAKPVMSQIEGATPRNKHGFKYSQKPKSTSVQHEAQYMSTMSVEIHVNTRGKLVPNPEEDEVQCIFWHTKSDENFMQSSPDADSTTSGLVVLSKDGAIGERIRRQASIEVFEEFSELDLMVRMVEIVRHHDPDVLTGYEVHGSSWGYLIERARLKYDYDLCDEFSRMKAQSHGRFGKKSDPWGFNTTSTIRVTGRHMINIWRAMRGELNLLQYTMENVVWHLLHERIPHYSWRTLTDWYESPKPRDLGRLLKYYTTRTRLDIDILEANELIPRTSEQARVLGVDFFSVFSRGSQFKVESIMFRIAKPENFVLVSPSKKQVGGQNALECLPLVMEPQSAFYNSPLLVLDFQSLYPSVMIAYNYCYSTFLGRVVNWRGTNKMGFTEYKRQQGLLRVLKDYINIAPNGIMYAKAEVRKSLLAKMLTEILETRVMVKSGMKLDKDDRTLQQLLNNRQLALKLLANVTYGYTSASFSGRMPCSEIADSIVQTARETLERSIAYIHTVERWGAEVVYGDTDSLFIYLKGKTKDQAFDIGNEIAKAITDMNPRPVKLKFEKVYHPCVLLAKKRYVGYKYESRDQVTPEFDAKGIETVRRDGTPAEQKIEEKALKLLFETADLSLVKEYFQEQCNKIMLGKVSVQDFCFAKEVRLGTYSGKGPPPPGALISTKRMLEDARAEPQYGERVPYVVTSGGPGARLADRCVAPEELLHSAHLSLDAEYYISKNIIPPLERIFNLVGANVRQWWDEMPRVKRARRVDPTAAGPRRTLESYLLSTTCVVCGREVETKGATACAACRRHARASLLRLQAGLNAEERKLADVVRVCQSCAGLGPLEGAAADVACDSRDCPVFYTRVKQAAHLRTERAVVAPVLRELGELALRKGALEW